MRPKMTFNRRETSFRHEKILFTLLFRKWVVWIFLWAKRISSGLSRVYFPINAFRRTIAQVIIQGRVVWWIKEFWIERFLVQSRLSARSSLGTRSRYGASGYLRVEIWQNTVINIGLRWGCPFNKDTKLALRHPNSR